MHLEIGYMCLQPDIFIYFDVVVKDYRETLYPKKTWNRVIWKRCKILSNRNKIDKMIFPLPVCVIGSLYRYRPWLYDGCCRPIAIHGQVRVSIIDGSRRPWSRIAHYNAIKICDFRQRWFAPQQATTLQRFDVLTDSPFIRQDFTPIIVACRFYLNFAEFWYEKFHYRIVARDVNIAIMYAMALQLSR